MVVLGVYTKLGKGSWSNHPWHQGILLPTFGWFFWGKCKGEYTIHGSYGYRTASKLLLWFLCHVYGEPLNNPFTMTFSPLTLCRTIVVWPTKKFNEWWKRRCRHCQLRVEKDISAYGTGDEIYVPWTQMTPVEWLELIGPSFGGNVSPPKHRTLTGSVL